MSKKQTALSGEDSAYVNKQLGHKKNDVAVACNVLNILQGDGCGGRMPIYSIDANHATYFVVRARHLRVLSSDDAEQLMNLSGRVFEVTVAFDKQKVSVFVFKDGHGGAQDRASFSAYAPPETRKRKQMRIDWEAGKVFDDDDQEHLESVVDDVYNYEHCMPDVRFFYEHIHGASGAPVWDFAALKQRHGAQGVGEEESSDGSLTTSEAAERVAKDSPGFAVCFLGMPECKLGTFSRYLRKKYGPIVPLVYASFGPPSPNPDASMLVVHVKKTVAAASHGQEMLRAKAPAPPRKKRKKNSAKTK